MELELVIRNRDGVERSFPIRAERTVIGREMRCDVRVPLPSVADRHCEIVVTGDAARLVDLGSEGGTFRNGDRIEQATELRADDRFTVGSVTFEVRGSNGMPGG